MERCGDTGRSLDAGPYPHVGGDSTEVQCIAVYGYLKGKSAMMIYERHANRKYKFGNRHFWAEGYYVSTVGLNEATIRKYIREQETHDQMMDKITTKELEDPFKGLAK